MSDTVAHAVSGWLLGGWLFGPSERAGSSGRDTPETIETSELAPAARVPNIADHALVERIRAGNRAAFDELFAAYWAPLWRFARAEIHSDAAAEDIVQDVFVRIWTRRAAWAPTHGVHAYLYRAIRNAIADRRRHDRVVRTHETLVSSDPDATLDHTRNAALLTEHRDLLTRLAGALAQLPERRRHAVLLRYEHGLAYAELAAVLEVSVAAAEKDVTRGLAALRAMLGG